MSTMGGDATAGVTIGFGFIWLICLFVGSGWQRTIVAYAFSMDVALYQVYIQPADAGAVVQATLKALIGVDWLPEGAYGLQDLATRFCTPAGIALKGYTGTDYCNGFKWLRFASIFMMFMGFIILLAHGLAAGFLLYFFHVDATEPGRKCARAFLILIPCLSLFSLMIYGMMTWSFSDGHISYGMAFFFCLFVSFLSIAPVIIFETCVNKNCERATGARAEIKAEAEFQAQGGFQGGMAQPMDPYGRNTVQMQSMPSGGYSQQQGGYPQGGGYPQTGGYPQYPPSGQQGGWPQQGGYPQSGQQGAYGQQQGYPQRY